MQQEQSHQLIKGAMALSAAALFAKILSAGYRIPYQNIAGDIGFYVYQQLYPFYGLVMLLSMYGFPVVISKRVAELEAAGQVQRARLTVAVSYYGLLVLAAAAWAAMYFSAPLLAQVMGDTQLTAPLRAVSLTFWFIPFLSVGRGLHQARRELLPTAISHISEQFVRVAMIIIFVVVIMSQTANPYDAGKGAVYGSLIGGVVGVIVIIFLSKSIAWTEWLKVSGASLKEVLSIHSLLFKQGIFICISALLFIFIQFIDAFTMIPLLQNFGLIGEHAYAAKGVYDRGQPLLQLGTIVTTTFSLALVPLIAQAIAAKEREKAGLYRDLAMRLTLFIGGAASIGLFMIIEPANIMLYGNSRGSEVLAVLAFAIFFSSIYLTTAAILQGYGYVHIPAWVMGLGILVKLGLNVLLVPVIGTLGSAVSTVAAIACMALVHLVIIRKLEDFVIRSNQYYWLLFGAMILLIVVTFSWGGLVSYLFDMEGSRIQAAAVALSTVMAGGAVIGWYFFFLPILKEEEWQAVPKLNKLRLKVRRR
ncbi:polysaccharide biosynthesis protein [Alkalihalophilus marmarensis]|uniref:polysaccharide biosynthesis protein n=1 Tax=Alkalihalophilus marmarensis TaxID=521377 RepID=UPI002DB91C77|nr:polysaccharide biosynthesis protein [Alkalihalophilus marmarensis]MEC2073566.1 polysaccharide biosynthesis protein [Alkalihalophilus marmarensis]